MPLRMASKGQQQQQQQQQQQMYQKEASVAPCVSAKDPGQDLYRGENRS